MTTETATTLKAVGTWTDPRTGTSYPVYMIPLAKIGLPEPYVRPGMSGQRVNLWVERVKATGWFLPPIKLRRLAEPIEVGKGDKKRTIDFRIRDGVHRYMTAVGIQGQDIAAIDLGIMTDEAYWTGQYADNADGPMPFDREGRDRYIREARRLAKPLADIAALVGLTETQVSRIAREVSGQTAEQVSKSRKAGAAKRKAGKKAGKTPKAKAPSVTQAWEPAHFFNGLRDFAKQAKARKADLTAYLQAKDSAWESAQVLIDELTTLRAVWQGKR